MNRIVKHSRFMLNVEQRIDRNRNVINNAPKYNAP